ncbi:hypothetical protein ACFLQ1_02120, partial [Candidatus Auribacterota bacterium]
EELFSFVKKNRKIREKVKKILVTFGGSDPKNLTAKLLKTFLSAKLSAYKITIVLGPGFREPKRLKEMIKKEKNYSFKENIGARELGFLALESDLCFSSGGITMYELAALGLPNIVLCQVPHEVINAKQFQRQGIVINLGIGTKFKPARLLKSVDFLDKNKRVREKMSAAGKRYVDGKGLERIVRIIMK